MSSGWRNGGGKRNCDMVFQWWGFNWEWKRHAHLWWNLCQTLLVSVSYEQKWNYDWNWVNLFLKSSCNPEHAGTYKAKFENKAGADETQCRVTVKPVSKILLWFLLFENFYQKYEYKFKGFFLKFFILIISLFWNSMS